MTSLASPDRRSPVIEPVIERPVTGQIASLGLAVLGLLVTHETAYAVLAWLAPFQGGGGLVDHGHQNLLMATAGPLALWATAAFVIRQVRRMEVVSTWGPQRLSIAIGSFYLVQESLEILAAGPGGPGLAAFIENRAILIGLVLTPLIARILLRMLAQAEELLAAWLLKSGPALIRAGETRPKPLVLPIATGIRHAPGDPRGPPHRDVTNLTVIRS